MASKTSFSVIGGRPICPAYCAFCMSSRSAAGGLGKKVRLKTSAFSLASVTSIVVCRHRSESVTLGGSVSLPLAHLATLQRASGESDAAATFSLCAVCKAFQWSLPSRSSRHGRLPSFLLYDLYSVLGVIASTLLVPGCIRRSSLLLPLVRVVFLAVPFRPPYRLPLRSSLCISQVQSWFWVVVVAVESVGALRTVSCRLISSNFSSALCPAS
jgi:hypothetical protein